jgi:4'-phosphopantetheinyl transferase
VSTPITSTVAMVSLVDARTVNDYQLSRFRGWLTASEDARYRRFMRPQRQRQFLIGRVLLRLNLSKLLAVAPESINLAELPGHAPKLILSTPVLSYPGFSLSHSGDWIACAVSAETLLGLDVEVVKPRLDILNTANHAFDAHEIELMNGFPEETRLIEFYNLWVKKEARYKLGACDTPKCVLLPYCASLSIALCSKKPLSVLPTVVLTKLPHRNKFFKGKV